MLTKDHIASLISSFFFNSLVTKLEPILEVRGERVRTVYYISLKKKLKIARGYQNVKNTACLVDNKYLSHMGGFQQYQKENIDHVALIIQANREILKL